MVADGKLAKRIDRLRQELQDETELALSDVALEELAYARFMEPHEGLRPAYGAVIRNSLGPRTAYGLPTLPSTATFLARGAPLDVLRLFADGRTAFLVRGFGEEPAVAIDPAWHGAESALAAYAAANDDVTVIQRLASGRIRVYVGDRVFSEESGIWLTRPTAGAYQTQVADVVDPEGHDVARAILELCVHSLSPSGHGATLVWFPGRTANPDGWLEPLDTDPYLGMSVAVTPPMLTAADESHAPAIAHALGQLDRAVVLEANGRLLHLNVTLGHADEFGSSSFAGGTRHNSSGKYSASDERAVVFVVSADGPVTVFRRGKIVAAYEPSPPSESGATSAAGDEGTDSTGL